MQQDNSNEKKCYFPFVTEKFFELVYLKVLYPEGCVKLFFDSSRDEKPILTISDKLSLALCEVVKAWAVDVIRREKRAGNSIYEFFLTTRQIKAIERVNRENLEAAKSPADCRQPIAASKPKELYTVEYCDGFAGDNAKVATLTIKAGKVAALTITNSLAVKDCELIKQWAWARVLRAQEFCLTDSYHALTYSEVESLRGGKND